jgi:hypothetical protein
LAPTFIIAIDLVQEYPYQWFKSLDRYDDPHITNSRRSLLFYIHLVIILLFRDFAHMFARWWWDKVLDLLGVLTFVQGHAIEAQEV